MDAAEVGAAAADAVSNDAAGDVAVAAASLVYAAVKKILSATKVCIKKKYLLSHLPLSPKITISSYYFHLADKYAKFDNVSLPRSHSRTFAFDFVCLS